MRAGGEGPDNPKTLFETKVNVFQSLNAVGKSSFFNVAGP